MLLRGMTELSAADFAPAFVVVAVLAAVSSWFFWQMPDDAGHEISGRKAVEISSRKGAATGRRKGRERSHAGRARPEAGDIAAQRCPLIRLAFCGIGLLRLLR